MLEELLGRFAVRDLLDRLPQPGIGAALGGQAVAIGRDAVLVERVGGDAVVGHLVHVVRADLQLQRAAGAAR